MGLLDGFLKDKEKIENELINSLYARVDQLSAAQLSELLRYTFTIFGDPGQGMYLIGLLIKKINRHIGCEFVPREKKDFDRWLTEFFAKTDLEKQRAVFVTAAFDVFKHNVISASGLIQKIDAALDTLKKTPEFNNLKG